MKQITGLFSKQRWVNDNAEEILSAREQFTKRVAHCAKYAELAIRLPEHICQQLLPMAGALTGCGYDSIQEGLLRAKTCTRQIEPVSGVRLVQQFLVVGSFEILR